MTWMASSVLMHPTNVQAVYLSNSGGTRHATERNTPLKPSQTSAEVQKALMWEYSYKPSSLNAMICYPRISPWLLSLRECLKSMFTTSCCLQSFDPMLGVLVLQRL